MKISEHLALAELHLLLQMVEESLGISSHFQLFNWLQQGVRPFIPHDIVIAAWGDFSLGLVRYDLVSALPGLRTDDLDEGVLHPFVSDLFVRWQHSNLTPYAVISSHGFNAHYRSHHQLIEKLRIMPSALVHGIKDQRGRHDCLYIFLGPSELGLERPRGLLRYLLPYVDAAFRQVAHLPEQYLHPVGAAAGDAPELALASADMDDPSTGELGLSAREHDIMEWVRAGKTNQEIGMILNISAFTVKNHIQRIFKKLNVVNRAQAVSKMGFLKPNGRR